VGIDLTKRIILFILSLIFIILLLSAANASAKEQRSAEKLLDSLIGYYTHDQKNHIVHATNLGWDFYTDIKYRNFEIALNFTKIGAEDKHPYAINNFGVMHEEGYAVDKDLNKAFDLYLEASKLPDVPWFTYSNLGRYFLLGIGNVDPSFDMAKENFTKAKELGGERATTAKIYLQWLEEKERLPHDYMELALWLEEQARVSNEVFINLGWLLDDYNKENAYEWFYLASLFGPSFDQIRATEITTMMELEFLEQDVFMKGRHKALRWLAETVDDNAFKPSSACKS
jgi:TPR repeat protein